MALYNGLNLAPTKGFGHGFLKAIEQQNSLF